MTMKRGPKPKLDRPTLWKTSIPASLHARVMTFLPKDWLTEKVKKGAQADLTTTLLTKWVEEQEAELLAKNPLDKSNPVP